MPVRGFLVCLLGQFFVESAWAKSVADNAGLRINPFGLAASFKAQNY
jgi:hypothetical protein